MFHTVPSLRPSHRTRQYYANFDVLVRFINKGITHVHRTGYFIMEIVQQGL